MEQEQHDTRVAAPDWLMHELDGHRFFDARLAKRLQELATQLWTHFGQSIPMACQDWANTKAAYRFLDNSNVHEDVILEGHFRATRERVDAIKGPLLILHDTTNFSFKREKPQAVGITNKSFTGRDEEGRPKSRTICGILMHSSLVVTPDGLPLGLAAIKFWNRQQFKGCSLLKRKINPTRVPVETKESFRWLDNLRRSTNLLDDPGRCVHVGDREGDIYELFCLALELDTHFLIRACADRMVGDGSHTIVDEMAEARVRGVHRVEVHDARGNPSIAVLELRFKKIRIRPPVGKRARYPDLVLTVLHATERGAPVGRERLDWKLFTDMPVTSRTQAIEKLHWYATRWKIETFHKIMKSGCKIEESKLRTSERLVNLIALYCILGWRIFWTTMMHRSVPTAPAKTAFTAQEVSLLDRLVPSSPKSDNIRTELSTYLYKLACLGGYLGRSRDPPPGNIVIWRGLARLTEIELGFELALEIVGN
ncbi:IS4 family transposase [Noviherbaspirillum malthae]|uniref:IS4 family transposase n=1 Tax=Noviherbaspirillum malthae TaxID=1260987 RepID=UPI001E3972D0|nr:IS4 family transposase [Noviherbaspirillum malthae]